jgi:integrase
VVSIFKQQYHVTDAKGRKVKRQSKKWYIQYKVGKKWVREPAYMDKTASLHLLLQKQTEADQEDAGMGMAMRREMARPIAEHVADFVKHLKDKGSTAIHCDVTEARIKRIIELGGITIGPQITKSRVDSAIAALRNKETWKNPISTRTANHYVGAIKHFAQWLVDERRNRENLIDGMHKKSLDGQRVKIRRPLSREEFAAVIAAAQVGPDWKEKRQAISGKDRVALYTLASFTGYRRKELSSIVPAAFTFGPDPSLEVVCGYSKRRRTERIPLNREVAAFFKRYVSKRPADQPIWPIGKLKTAQMIKADMDAAGISHKAGIVIVDFHSLRQTFTTDLARAGVSPKVNQQLSRHSDVNLTMNVYAKMNQSDERAAVESLPVPDHLTHQYAQDPSRHRKASLRHAAKKMVSEATNNTKAKRK